MPKSATSTLLGIPMNNDLHKDLPTVLVLGGAGFVGRHAVTALLDFGAKVIVGTRHPDAIGDRLPAEARTCSRQRVRLEILSDAADWSAHIKDADVVLNCVGILRQVGASTYDKVHHRAPAALASACSRSGKRFVHVSALGLNPNAKSRFISSKIAGESSIMASTTNWIIARPSLLDGSGGFGARWLRGVAKLPAFFTPSGAKGKIAALDVSDLGIALARLCTASEAELKLGESRIFELGGSKEFLFHDYIRALRKSYTDAPSVCIRVPNQLARLFAHFCDLIRFSPFSFGHWEMLQRDNKPALNRLPELLRRPPTAVAPNTRAPR